MNKISSLEDFRKAKRSRNADALARAILARAEDDGQSVTDWLADQAHAAECAATEDETKAEK